MLGFEAAAGLGVICGRGRAGRQAGWPRQWAAAQSSESPQKSRQKLPWSHPALASLLPVVTLHRDCDQVTLLKVEQPPSFIARKNTHDQQVPGRLPMLRRPVPAWPDWLRRHRRPGSPSDSAAVQRSQRSQAHAHNASTQPPATNH